MAAVRKRSSMAVLRLMSDLKVMNSEPPAGCSASPVSDDNMFEWDATVIGPEESPWEGGMFSLKMLFPSNYPDAPPKVRFTCEMFHPNVYADGSLCLDVIQDKWTPVYTVGMLLASIQSLLTDPNPDSPANVEAAKLWQTDKKQYRRKVRRVAAKTLE